MINDGSRDADAAGFGHLTDLRGRSKGATQFAILADAVNAIRSAGRLPS
jgi:hypothetical protein